MDEDPTEFGARPWRPKDQVDTFALGIEGIKMGHRGDGLEANCLESRGHRQRTGGSDGMTELSLITGHRRHSVAAVGTGRGNPQRSE